MVKAQRTKSGGMGEKGSVLEKYSGSRVGKSLKFVAAEIMGGVHGGYGSSDNAIGHLGDK